MRDRYCRRDAEGLIGYSVVNVEKQGYHVEVSKGAPSADRLGCNVFNGLACIKTHYFIFCSIETLDEHSHSQGWNFPDRVSMFVIQLCSCIEKEFS